MESSKSSLDISIVHRMVFRLKKRSPILLLEVMIAFVLVVLCALPLVAPHVYILQSEKQLISTVELDHQVSLLFANRLEKLYQNKLPWEDVVSGKVIEVDGSLLESIGYQGVLPFKGTYQFVKERVKQSSENQEPAEKAVYLFKLLFTFVPTVGKGEKKPLRYEYQIAIERQFKK